MELATTPEEEAAADQLLATAGIAPGMPMALLNPGGNNPAKRWPMDRFATLADHLSSPQPHHPHQWIAREADLVASIAAACRVAHPVQLPALGINLGSLKALTRRCRIMVTNDTGPRHVAAAFGVPVVSLFGPTDHRWTTIPTRPNAPEILLTADPTLPETESANDHPDRCRIDRIELGHGYRCL